jgi:hypothetical protein
VLIHSDQAKSRDLIVLASPAHPNPPPFHIVPFDRGPRDPGRDFFPSWVAAMAYEGAVERYAVDVLRALRQVGPDRKRQVGVERIRHETILRENERLMMKRRRCVSPKIESHGFAIRISCCRVGDHAFPKIEYVVGEHQNMI